MHARNLPPARPDSRLARNLLAGPVSASLTGPSGENAAGIGCPRRRGAQEGNDVPVVILLRSRIDSKMCRECHARPHAPLPARPAGTHEFDLKWKDCFPSRLESYFLAESAFRGSEEGIHHGGQSNEP